MQQFGGAYFSTEGALWRTLGLLLARPGELTRRNLAGKRKHYVLPLRLYLTISLVVLLLMRLSSPGLATNLNQAQIPEIEELGEKPTLTVLEFGEGRGVGLKDGQFICDGLPAWVCDRVRERLDLDRKSLLRELRLWPERFMSRWGTAMFLLVPIFAALTQLAYLRRGLRYTEHLVYALHLHSFWFIASLVALLPVPGAELALLAMPVYTLLAARRVYGGGWFGTLARAALVAALYGLVMGVALGVVAVWAFFFG